MLNLNLKSTLLLTFLLLLGSIFMMNVRYCAAFTIINNVNYKQHCSYTFSLKSVSGFDLPNFTNHYSIIAN